MIIGLSGFAQAGKDEAAKYLVKKYGFIHLAFADKLREFLLALNPPVGVKDGELVYLKEAYEEYGWDVYKKGPYKDVTRQLLQRLGTEAGRETLWPSIWIEATLRPTDMYHNYVISDARFINEFEAIASSPANDGFVVRIDRPGVGPANDHASEMEALQYLNKFDYWISNDGTLEEFHQKLDNLMKAI
jgi:hypothetical protein